MFQILAVLSPEPEANISVVGFQAQMKISDSCHSYFWREKLQKLILINCFVFPQSALSESLVSSILNLSS
jgi:hypothetical protein